MNLIDKTIFDEFLPSPVPHLTVRDHTGCLLSCRGECARICPAGVFQVQTVEADGPKNANLAEHQGGKQIVINILYERCLECGACLYVCPQGKIVFDYPRGGYGIVHKYG